MNTMSQITQTITATLDNARGNVAHDRRRAASGSGDKPSWPWARESLLDRTYSRIFNNAQFFVQGWGPEAVLEGFATLPERVGTAARIDVLWTHQERRRTHIIREGVFLSPMAHKLPSESRRAPIRLVLPTQPRRRRAVFLHLAATGDEGFARRYRTFAVPLAQRGVASLILENAYYGQRRPVNQFEVFLRSFSDLLLMGEATVREGRALVRWLDREGYETIGVTGVSMGGHMSTLIGAVSDAEVAIAPCIGMHSAAPVFTEGVLSQKIAWETLGATEGGREAARLKMREVLGFSDIRRYPQPQRPDATVCVSATRDAYINNGSIQLLQAHWPGSEVRWVNSGHVRAFVSHSRAFLKAMHDALARLEGMEARR